MSAKNMFIVGILSLLCLSGCANPDQITVLEKRLNSYAMDNTTMMQEINRIKETRGATVSPGTSASISNRLDELQAEILRINGRLDQITYKMDHVLSTSERAAQTAMTSTPPPSSPGTSAAHVSTEKKEPPAPPPPPRTEDFYQTGMNFFNKKEYKEAKRNFQEFVDKNPGGDKADNAYFMMGESEFKLERYEEAILDYQKVIDKFPKSEKVPDALYNQGESFAKLGDNIGAKIVFKKLVTKYPNSSQAKDANAQLSKLR